MDERKELEKGIRTAKIVSYAALGIGIIAILVGVLALMNHGSQPSVTLLNSSNMTVVKLSNANLLTPPLSLAADPVVTKNQSFGSRLTDINAPLNASELAVINNAKDSYFETAANMLLNGSMNGLIYTSSFTKASYTLQINGKPTVIYLGAISCIFCGENRWAMALALGRFGSFSQLFNGYSSFGDGDLPTLYWAPAHYNSTSAMDLGNFYQSSYINFASMDYASPITGGFQMQGLSYVLSQAQATNNTAYTTVAQVIIKNNNFQGTPYTIWGNFAVPGADASDFGNGTLTNSSHIPMTYMTHADVFSQLANPNDKFAWTEYAAADLYVAALCSSINNTAPICSSIPQMKQLESTI